VTYQRIVELGLGEDIEEGRAVSRHEVYGPRAEDITEDELKLCFHRVTLYLEQSHVYNQSYQQDPSTTNYRPSLQARRNTYTWFRSLFPHYKPKGSRSSSFIGEYHPLSHVRKHSVV
jgi:hypothetical protein